MSEKERVKTGIQRRDKKGDETYREIRHHFIFFGIHGRGYSDIFLSTMSGEMYTAEDDRLGDGKKKEVGVAPISESRKTSPNNASPMHPR
jgi:hypothetical protein